LGVQPKSHIHTPKCYNSNFGLATKVRAWKSAGWKCNLGITFTLLGVLENVREWTHTLPIGLPLRELESQWTPESLKNNLRNKKSLDWGLPYTIEIFLRHRCLKRGRIIHLTIYNTSYGRKKGRESKCQFDSRPLKVRNCLDLHGCRRHAAYHWKALNKDYNFTLDFDSIRGLHKKLWASKVMRVPISRIARLLIWSFSKNTICV
jgi:hypothetical protein